MGGNCEAVCEIGQGKSFFMEKNEGADPLNYFLVRGEM